MALHWCFLQFQCIWPLRATVLLATLNAMCRILFKFVSACQNCYIKFCLKKETTVFFFCFFSHSAGNHTHCYTAATDPGRQSSPTSASCSAADNENNSWCAEAPCCYSDGTSNSINDKLGSGSGSICISNHLDVFTFSCFYFIVHLSGMFLISIQTCIRQWSLWGEFKRTRNCYTYTNKLPLEILKLPAP